MQSQGKKSTEKIHKKEKTKKENKANIDKLQIKQI